MLRKNGAAKYSSSHKQQQVPTLTKIRSEKLISLSQLQTQTCSQTPRMKSVRFSQSLVNMKPVKPKYRSPSILRQSRFHIKTEKTLGRSSSITSLGGQNPLKDDQSCENTEMNKKTQEEYESIMRKFLKRGSYHDELFPHVVSTVISNSLRNKQKPENVLWMRISEVFPQNQLVVLSSDPGRNVIKASEQVSEYFTLGLNCLKFSKSTLWKIFGDQKCNHQGIYYVKIFHGNIWKQVLVDDYIPVTMVKDKKNQPAYTPTFIYHGLNRRRNESIQIWPILLEKALAKVYRSYSALNSGNIYDFLQELTNFPYEYYDLQNKQCSLKEVFKWKEVIAFGETKKGEKVALQIGVGQSQKIMFVKGQNERKQIVESSQLRKYFEGIYIFSGKKYSYVGYCPIKQTKQSISVRKFTLLTKSECSLTLLQKDEKFYGNLENFKYSWVRLLLFQKEVNDRGYRWVDGRYDNYKSLTLEEELDAGEYFVIVMPEWEQMKRFFEMNLIIRCKIPTILDRLPYKDGAIEEGCSDLAQRFGVLNQLNRDICSYNCIHEDLGLIIENFNNEREKGCVRITKKIIMQKKNIGVEEDPLRLEPLNTDFKRNLKAQITIKGGEHYTLVMMTKGGVNRSALEKFNFESH